MEPLLLQPTQPWPWSRPPVPLPTWVHIRPSRDAQAKGQRAQDAVALTALNRSLLVAVCDGVSQSFFGDFAAWVLAEALVEWLASWPPDAPLSGSELLAWEAQWRRTIQERYETLPLPEDLPAMMRRVLEEKRTLGSETMFAAVRIDSPSSDLPQGRLLILHGGNIRLRIFGPEAERTFSLEESLRWSTTRGFTGEPHIWQSPLQDMDGTWLWHGLVVYTDGIPSLDAHTPPWDLDTARRVAQEDWNSPLSDDQAYVEVRWVGPEPEGHFPWPEVPEAPALPHMEGLEQGQLVWRLPEHGLYARVHWQGEGRGARWSTPEARMPAPAWARRVRVQGIDVAGRPSPWTPWFTLPATEVTLPSWAERLILTAVGLFLLAYFVLLLLKVY